VIMAVSIVLLLLVLVPGMGVEVNGAKRWLGAGLFQIQPSEIAKVALVLHGAALLATRPRLTRSLPDMVPFLMPVVAVCLLVVLEPDLGTAMVSGFTAVAMLIAAGAKMRHLMLLGAGAAGLILLAIMIEPYRMERLTGFINPSADPAGAGFQATQAQIALGSGGLFGVGVGGSLQKAFYLPEAHTDMIAAVIGEEMGLLGMMGLAGLFGLFAYAGLRTAQRARDRYTKLLAAGLVSLVMVQATINLFAVLGLAPLTGVPLPFVSYGNSSLLVLLAAVGLLLNIADGARVPAAKPRTAASRPAKRATGRRTAKRSAGKRPGTARAAPGRRQPARAERLRVVEGGRDGGQRRSSSSRAKGRDSRGRDRRARRSGSRRR
jgi:cell division protein FtsW